MLIGRPLRPLVRGLVIVLVVGAAAAALRVFAPSALEPQAALDALRGLPLATQVGAYLLAYVLLTTLAVPAFAFAIVAGIAFGLPWGFALAFFAANVASNLHFFLGRAAGAERVAPWLDRKGLHLKLDKNTITAMLLLRAVPSPFLLANLAAGAAGVRWPTFLLGSGLGLVPQTLAFTALAAQVHAGVEGARATAIAWGVGGVCLLLAFTVVGRRVLRQSAAAQVVDGAWTPRRPP